MTLRCKIFGHKFIGNFDEGEYTIKKVSFACLRCGYPNPYFKTNTKKKRKKK